MNNETQDEKPPRRPKGTNSKYGRNGWWYVQYYINGIRYQEAVNSRDERRADARLRRRVNEIERGEFVGPKADKVAITELADDFLRDYRVNGRKSLDDAEARWRLHLKPVFGRLRAVQVTADAINKYVDTRQQSGASNAEINRELAALKRMYKLGHRDNKLSRLPKFPPKLKERVRTGFVDDAQYTALANECSRVGLWLRAMLEVASTYGWREGELLSMQVKQVDLLRRTIRLEPGTTKNDEGREVTMTPAVFELLSACLVGKTAEHYVFTRGKKHKRITEFRGSWRRVCAAVGLGHLACPSCQQMKPADNGGKKCAKCNKSWKWFGTLVHDLRRVGARNLRHAGVAEGVIMKIGGWKTRSVFERYAIVSQADISDALVKLAARQQSVQSQVAPQIDCKLTARAKSSTVAATSKMQ